MVFPAAGSWDYVIDDGFTREHTYPPVRIGDGVAAPAGAVAHAGEDGGGPWLALGVAGAAALLLAALVAALVRRGPAPARG